MNRLPGEAPSTSSDGLSEVDALGVGDGDEVCVGDSLGSTGLGDSSGVGLGSLTVGEGSGDALGSTSVGEDSWVGLTSEEVETSGSAAMRSGVEHALTRSATIAVPEINQVVERRIMRSLLVGRATQTTMEMTPEWGVTDTILRGA